MKIDENADIKISKKKINYPLNNELFDYLKENDRYFKSPITYNDLLRYTEHYPIYDKYGKDTLWIGVVFNHFEMDEINEGIKKIYQWLKSNGNEEATGHLIVDNIDYCTFGNSNPFRIKIRNQYNDNHDYFYIKKADASRVYGLELEHILSPNHINFLVYEDTLVEEHISGIPGDMFLENYMNEKTNRIRLAKEFVKFNERCFMRLLGDQRSYNFVIVLTPDFDEMQYRIRSIDFDQQCYEGRINLYKPQFFRENLKYVKCVTENVEEASIKQYQDEERALLAKRMIADKVRLEHLLKVMKKDHIAPQEKVESLKSEIYDYLKDNQLKHCKTMGEIVDVCLQFILRNYMTAITNR